MAKVYSTGKLISNLLNVRVDDIIHECDHERILSNHLLELIIEQLSANGRAAQPQVNRASASWPVQQVEADGGNLN